MVGLSKHFKRKPKSVSHFTPPPPHTLLWNLSIPCSFLSFSHIHTQLSSGFLGSVLHFSSWSWFMTFSQQTLWPLALFLPFSPSRTHRHMNTTQTHFFLFCSFSSLLSLSVFYSSHSPAVTVDVCYTAWYVWRRWRSRVTHTYTHHVLAVWGVEGQAEKSEGEKEEKEREGGKSKEASLSNHRTVITVAAAGSKPDFRCALRHWRGLLYTQYWLTRASSLLHTQRRERVGEGEERRTNPALMRSGYVWERGTASQSAQDLNVVKLLRVKCIVSGKEIYSEHL